VTDSGRPYREDRRGISGILRTVAVWGSFKSCLRRKGPEVSGIPHTGSVGKFQVQPTKEGTGGSWNTPDVRCGFSSVNLRRKGPEVSGIPHTGVWGSFKSCLQRVAAGPLPCLASPRSPRVREASAEKPREWNGRVLCRLDLNHAPDSRRWYSREGDHVLCRLDLNHPPTPVGGIQEKGTMSFVGWT
jgi:hypothetical protein